MTKYKLRLFLAFLVFSTWQFSVASADAHVVTNMVYNWKSPAEAMDALEIAVLQLETNLNAQTPGSPAYLDTKAHITYYNFIHGFIEQGKGVEESTKMALGYVDTAWLGLDSSTEVLDAHAMWYNDALQLLTQ